MSKAFKLIFSHQKVCWHHCCHSNLDLETTGQLPEMPMRGERVCGGHLVEGVAMFRSGSIVTNGG